MLPVAALVGGGLALGGGLASGIGSWLGGKNADSAASKGAAAAMAINDKNRKELAKLYGDPGADASKYAALMQQAGAGYTPIDSSKYLLGAQALNPGAFSGNVDVAQDPGYQFRMDEAQKALEAQQAKTGTLRSGFAAKDMAKYMQGLASQEYQNAYNRYLSTYNTQLGAQNQAFSQGMQQLGADIGQSQFGSTLNMNALSQLYGGANNNLNAYATGIAGLNQNDLQTVMSKYSTIAQNAIGNNPLSAVGNAMTGFGTGLAKAK